MITYPIFVGELPFANYAAAAAYCEQHEFSPTVIHHEPLKLPRKYEEKLKR